MLVRQVDWADRLMWAVRARVSEPFAYGEHDCCLAAAALVEAMVGGDPVSRKLRGYKSTKGAQTRLLQHGGVVGLARHVLDGCEEIKPAFAQRGDVVACNVIGDAETGAAALGVVSLDGRWAYVANSPAGWAKIEMQDWTHAWRIAWP